MKGILYYFSGTGNTKWVADRFKDEFGLNNIDLKLINIESLEEVNMKGYDFVIIGSSIYGKMQPKIVDNFLNILPSAKKSIKAIIYSTQGAKSSSATSVISKMLDMKGFRVVIQSSIKMPNNYYFISGEKPNVDEQKEMLKNAEIKVKNLTSYFLENRESKEKIFFPRLILGKISARAFRKVLPKLSRNITAAEDCIKCGLCLRNCPQNNITFENGHAVFHSKCMMCLRCIHICPKNAIRYKGKKISQTQKEIINCLSLSK
jgi:Flavodoxins